MVKVDLASCFIALLPRLPLIAPASHNHNTCDLGHPMVCRALSKIALAACIAQSFLVH